MVPPVPSSTLTLSLLPRTGNRVGVSDEFEGGMGLKQEEEKINPAFLGVVRGKVIWELRSGMLEGSNERFEALLMEQRET